MSISSHFDALSIEHPDRCERNAPFAELELKEQPEDLNQIVAIAGEVQLQTAQAV